MKKISTKIIAGIVSCSLLISVIIGGISILKSTNTIEIEVQEKIAAMTKGKAMEFNTLFNNIENSTNFLSITVESEFHLEDLNKDSSYIEKYKEKIDPIIKKLSENTEGAMGAYVFFNPELSNKLEYSWYADVDNTNEYKTR